MKFRGDFIGYGAIKNKARVRQDFSGFEICFKEDEPPLIWAVFNHGTRYKCVCDGYGSFLKGETYGNGSVYVKKEDVVIFKES